jgi:hypothetical protein
LRKEYEQKDRKTNKKKQKKILKKNTIGDKSTKKPTIMY